MGGMNRRGGSRRRTRIGCIPPIAMSALLALAGCAGDRNARANGTGTNTTLQAAAGEIVGRRVDIGGRTLFLACAGESASTVVIEMGFDADIGKWRQLQLQLASDGFRACVYQRAGWGASDPAPAPRDASATASDFVALTKAAPLALPLVVVSSSGGSTTTELLVRQHPGLVSGVVFVDPRSAEYEQGHRAHLTAKELAEQDKRIQDGLRSERGPELAAGGESARQVLTAGPVPPGLPFAVLTAGNSPTVSDRDRAFWRETHKRLAASSMNGRHEVVEGAGHLIWLDRPGVVVEAIRWVAT